MKPTPASLREAKASGHRLATLTAYDYPTARLLDECGLDFLLVGDSLGMVVLGHPDTTHVTMADMIHHTRAVARGASQTLVAADLPAGSCATPELAVESSRRLREAGADLVKIEGGVECLPAIQAILADGIPLIGHLGMLPQRVIEEGGYHKKGKTPEQSDAIHEGAEALIAAGVFAIVLESVIPATARELTASLSVPTIGIGCGDHTCDGEIAVITDVLGSFPWFVPPFARPEADLANSIRNAASQYIARVQNR